MLDSHRRHFFCKFVKLLLFLIFFHQNLVSGDERNFPKLFNVGQSRPVTTWPSSGTCGVETQSAFCASSTLTTSLSCQKSEICDQQCPYSSHLPSGVDLLVGSGYGQCLFTDLINVAPYSIVNTSYSVLFLQIPTFCHITPSASISFGPDGSCTFSTFVSLAARHASSNATLFTKFNTKTNAVIFLVEVSTNGIGLEYKTSLGQFSVFHHQILPSDTWFHLAVQIYNTSASFFVNGLGTEFSPAGTYQLAGPIADESLDTVLRVGLDPSGTRPLHGHLQATAWYNKALSNREIVEVQTRVLPSVHVESNCRCPPSHPRVRPIDQIQCIPNSESVNTDNRVSRINSNAHPLSFVNDGDWSTFWVSEYLSNVSISIDFGDSYQIIYVLINFYSPLPQALSIEKESNSTWSLWQRFATDCRDYFGMPNNGKLPTSTAVNCLNFIDLSFSKANVTFNLLAQPPNARPGYDNFYNSSDLYDFSLASSIRINMQNHQNVTHPRHKYYGIYAIYISGRCNCHGHAETCETSKLPYKCNCLPSSFTEGNKCERCLPLYNDKPFRIGDRQRDYPCKPCQCHSHASSCVYNASLDEFPEDFDRGGGGVCLNCLHHTGGRNCEECVSSYFRPTGVALNAPEVCSPCNCNYNGTVGGSLECQKVGGQCNCKNATTTRTCGSCKDGFFNLSKGNPAGCSPCGCNTAGTDGGSKSCDNNGTCKCKKNVRGRKCDACQYGYFGLSASDPEGCQPCQCSPQGSKNIYCNPLNGQCECKDRRDGRTCDRCANDFYNFTAECIPCQCVAKGTEAGTICNGTTGQCRCKVNVWKRDCSECRDGFHTFGLGRMGCATCECNVNGTNASTVCDKETGRCHCKELVKDPYCRYCRRDAFNLTFENPRGCSPCECDPTGTVGDGTSVSCDATTGDCPCVTYRIGRRCDRCKAGYFKVTDPKEKGCTKCVCDALGKIPGSDCDPETGQCQCRTDRGVGGQRCDECVPTYFNYRRTHGQCDPCACNEAGSVNATCTPTGICFCKSLVEGDKCNVCKPGSSILQVNNPYGCSTAPAQMGQPMGMALSPYAIFISWGLPDQPNGIIYLYKLFRDGILITNVTEAKARHFNDTGLLPYTDYSYYVTAHNSKGSTSSRPVIFRTLPTAPQGRMRINVSEITSTTAFLTWGPPTRMNGQISAFQVLSINPSAMDTAKVHWSGIGYETRVAELIPFTNYSFYIKACTIGGGCKEGEKTSFVTPSSPPVGVGAPNVTALSASSLFIEWTHPMEPNGVIFAYEVWMRKRGEAPRRIHLETGQYNPRPTFFPNTRALPVPATNFTQRNLQPYSIYYIQIIAQNDAGKSASVWVEARTGEAVPLAASTLTITALSSGSLRLTWSKPTPEQIRGEVIGYHIYQQKVTDRTTTKFGPPTYVERVLSLTPNRTTADIGGFSPYTLHIFKLEVCNSVGCMNGSWVLGRTEIAAPQTQAMPVVEGYNSTSMLLFWSPPLKVNGPSPTYVLERASSSFSTPPPAVMRGIRMAGTGYYQFPHDAIPENVAFTGIRFRFRTSQRNGLLFFAGSEGLQEEFVSIYMKESRIYFAFDTSKCRPVLVIPSNDEAMPYNDGRWHYLNVRRKGGEGSIQVDNYWRGDSRQTTNCESSNIIGINNGVYWGGLPADFKFSRPDISTEILYKIPRLSYLGCIRDAEILTEISPSDKWVRVNWTQATTPANLFASWEGCPININLRSGVHFLGEGFLQFPSTIFEDGTRPITFSLSMRTEMESGLLLFAYGAENVYLILQLQNRILEAFASTSAYLLHVVSNQPDLCNGRWQAVKLALSNDRFSLTVNNNDTTAYVSTQDLTTRFSLISSLFVGGIDKDHPPSYNFIHSTASLKNRQFTSFGGCIKDLRIIQRRDKLINIHEHIINSNNVNLDECPAASVANISSLPCQTTKVATIYTGGKLNFTDTGLQPFTEYIYRVTSSNPKGSAVSKWAHGRSREGIPYGVLKPFNISSVTGAKLWVKWPRPYGHTGLITQYFLKAYDGLRANTTVTSPPITKFDPEQSSYSDFLDNVIPYTNYSVRVIACTRAGCRESEHGLEVRTLEDVPADVNAPGIGLLGPSWLHLVWSSPGYPNGRLTGYELFRNSELIYKGGLRQYNDSMLQVYTDYTYEVQACTQIGCTKGPAVILRTGQLPPNFVEPPTLTVRDSKRILVRWTAPTILNGRFTRYMLYQTTNLTSHWSVAYNRTEPVTQHELKDLLAGTEYFIRVLACTGGGCTSSVPSSARTEESSPEGVYSPTVTSPDFSSLQVSWRVPQFPNGFIVSYLLFHNGLLIANVSATMPRSFSVSGLQPWTLHVFYIKACTVKGCGTSPEVSVWTQEAPPIGEVKLQGIVVDSRTVELDWTNPIKPNGNLSFHVKVTGPFYKDPATWDYTLVTEERLLLNVTTYGKHTLTTLIPFTDYFIFVEAVNTKGFLKSNVYKANMPPGTPDGVKPPKLTALSSTSVSVEWGFVGRNNGRGTPSFQLQMRASSGAYSDLFSSTTFSTSLVKNGLLPYSSYEFRVAAINLQGSTFSKPSLVTTKEAAPSGVAAPSVDFTTASEISLRWTQPTSPNGVLTKVKIYTNDVLQLEVADVAKGEAKITGLEAYTVYRVKIGICTSVGCTDSDEAQTRTLSKSPDGVPAPTLFSETATSVLISFSGPSKPNGLLLAFSIERRLFNDSATTAVVHTVTPGATMRFLDQSEAITPFTRYQYRVVVNNTAGSGVSPWATVTTRSTQPLGLSPPTISDVSSRGFRVTWTPPVKPNGVIQRYEIFVSGSSTLLVTDTQITARNVTGLVPYTEYSVRVMACTVGGCATSPAASTMTMIDVPEGLASPTATVLTRDFISVVWTQPAFPNGPPSVFELYRMKVRQPLIDVPVDLGEWKRVYTGLLTFYEDRDIQTLTTYLYYVTFHNSKAAVRSANSTAVISYGLKPISAGNLSAVAVSYNTIRVNWTTPSVQMMRGYPEKFRVIATSPKGLTVHKEFSGSARSGEITNLLPNTNYSLALNLTVTGGGFFLSPPLTAVLTLDGAPFGLSPPRLESVSESTLRAFFTAPEHSNGLIIAYYLFLDGRKIDPRTDKAGSYLLTGLRPYTPYSVRVQVCTVYSCTTSDDARGATMEALPQDLDPPTTNVINSSAINVAWSNPKQPNGVILRIELWREAHEECTNGTEQGQCRYVICALGQRLCGSQCFDPSAQVCCGGKRIHKKEASFACCKEDYLPLNGAAVDAECCGGKFHPRKTGFQCCGAEYVAVSDGQICCPGSGGGEVRGNLGFGTACCGNHPFNASATQQVCCNGALSSGYERRCCGNQMVPEAVVCCGDSVTGIAYNRVERHQCCGSVYVAESNTTLCCRRDSQAKIHFLGVPGDTRRCCGIQLMNSDQACCKDRGFDPNTHVCADRAVSGGTVHCGTGLSCPRSSASRAYCNSCVYRAESQTCGVYQSPATPTAMAGPRPLCWSASRKVYSGLALNFTDSQLTPYTEYRYHVRAMNSIGSVNGSSPVVAQTLEAAPGDVLSPRTLALRINVVLVRWTIPSQPNGVISQYVLRRGIVGDGTKSGALPAMSSLTLTEIYRGTDLSTTDSHNVQPFTVYAYTLSACTSAGCSQSPLALIATEQAAPSLMAPPTVTGMSATQCRVSWTSPGPKSNGIITKYVVYELTERRKVATTVETSFNVTSLKPFTQYRFLVSACTSAGCTNSSAVSHVTGESQPQGFGAPTILVIDRQTLHVLWAPPSTPNGIISKYSVYRRYNGVVIQVGDVPGTTTEFRITNLSPGRSYEVIVRAMNGAGFVDSPAAPVNVPTNTPTGIQLPLNVTALGPTRIYVEWRPPTNPNGIIDLYKVALISEGRLAQKTGYGTSLSATVHSLTPYTRYLVHIVACVAGIPNGCATGPGAPVRTLEAAPSGMDPPILTATRPIGVRVQWKPPTKPNGRLIEYRVERKFPGISTSVVTVSLSSDVYKTDYVDQTTSLSPYQGYEYRVVASNGAGRAESPWASVRTLEDLPQDVTMPVIEKVGPFSVAVRWLNPQKPNGNITGFMLNYQHITADPTATHAIQSIHLISQEANFTTRIFGLRAYTSYRLRLGAVNTAGTGYSPWTEFRTNQSSPAGLGSLTMTVLSSGIGIDVSWNEPTENNGEISAYNLLLRQGSGSGSWSVVYSGMSRNFQVRSLTPFTEYHAILEVCTVGGCSRTLPVGVKTAEIQPSGQSAPLFGSVGARYVQLRWSPPASPFGIITQYEIWRGASAVLRRKRSVVSQSLIYTKNVTGAVANTTVYQYTDLTPRPYTRYHYRIRACNAKGCTDSVTSTVVTAQAGPEQVRAPTVAHILGTPSSLNLTWSPPGLPNGVIQSYQLQRNGSQVQTYVVGSGPIPFVFEDTGLLPYTVYAYSLTVCTQATSDNCAISPQTTIRTLEASPTSVAVPTIVTVDATRLRVSWTPPSLSNGAVESYRLLVDGLQRYSGRNLTTTVTGLTPYTEYVFRLRACTLGGCTDSKDVSGRTNEAPPQGLSPPQVNPISPSIIEVSWSPPRSPNGKLLEYKLLRDGAVIDTAPATRTFYRDTGLKSGSQHSYALVATNAVGQVVSSSVIVSTLASAPDGLQTPTLTPLSATALLVSWTPPSIPNGLVRNYSILLDGVVQVPDYTSTSRSGTLGGLKPFHTYRVRVRVCTDGGCSLTGEVSGTTMESAPKNQPSPILIPLGDSTNRHLGVRVDWSPPALPNGVIRSYRVDRRYYTPPTSTTSAVEGPAVKVYEGSFRQFFDNSTQLRPYTNYQYRVTAFNNQSEGATSTWTLIRTKEAPPEGVFPPRIDQVNSHSVKVQIVSPGATHTNGYILRYNVLVNNSLASSNRLLVHDISNLTAFSVYKVEAQLCTSPGCTKSTAVAVKTLAALPGSVSSLRLVSTTNTSASIAWNVPDFPNGVLSRYIIESKTPLENMRQSFAPPSVTSFTIENLMPYTSYRIRVRAQNQIGQTPPSEEAWINGTTATSEPLFVSPAVFSLNASNVIVDWSSSFQLNGPLVEYSLWVDSNRRYVGIETSYQHPRETKEAIYTFQVEARTSVGKVRSPFIVFDVTQPGFRGTVAPTTDPSAPQRAIYQEVWFISLLAIVGVALLVTALVLVLKCTRRRHAPYVRERQPLQPRQPRIPLPPTPIDMAVANGKTGDPKGTGGRGRGTPNDLNAPGSAYRNPAYLSSNSVLELNWENDSSHSWGANILQYDSAFNSLVYEGEDSIAGSSLPPKLILESDTVTTKSQMLLTDTHI